MNITLSADEEVIRKCREYARAHDTSLNKLIRDYLHKLVAKDASSSRAPEFAEIAAGYAGEWPPEYRLTTFLRPRHLQTVKVFRLRHAGKFVDYP